MEERKATQPYQASPVRNAIEQTLALTTFARIGDTGIVLGGQIPARYLLASEENRALLVENEIVKGLPEKLEVYGFGFPRADVEKEAKALATEYRQLGSFASPECVVISMLNLNLSEKPFHLSRKYIGKDYKDEFNKVVSRGHKKKTDIVHFQAPVADDGKEQSWLDLKKHLPKVFSLIDKAREEKKMVYVHCSSGQSRSASTVAAYLMSRFNLSAEEAIDAVRVYRNIIEPKGNFVKGLNAGEFLRAQDDAGATCCPPSRVPRLARPVQFVAKGKDVKIGTLDAYEVGRRSSKGCVVVIHDIFGWNSGRHKLLCDQFAEKGYYVVMPDLFRGERCFRGISQLDMPSKMEFIKRMSLDRWQRDMDAVWRYLYGASEDSKMNKEDQKSKESREIDRSFVPCNPDQTALLGFCWGHWVVFHESARGKVAAGASFHPSGARLETCFGRKIEDLTAKITCPQLMGPCKGDLPSCQEGGSIQQVLLKLPGVGHLCEYHSYKDLFHGFVTQGDVDDEAVKFGINDAIQKTDSFFRKIFDTNNKKTKQ